jgi:hypothetical protein
MEEINHEKNEMGQEEIEIVIWKASEYTNACLAIFNSIMSKAKENGDSPELEATSLMQALTAISISIITSLGGNKERACTILTTYLDHLDTFLMGMEEMPSDDSYKASEDNSPQAITETNEEWLSRQKSNEHDVTCCEPNDSKP